MAKKILIIDDEPFIVESICCNLQLEGYEPSSATDGRAGLQMALNCEFDLIILDILLPNLNGFEICRAVRRQSEVPIIILSARVGEIDRVLGLELGADDYVTKPFSMRELLARIKTILKRTDVHGSINPYGSETVEAPKQLRCGDLEIDLLGHEIFVKGVKVNLSVKEFELVRILAEHRGEVLPRTQLLNLAWGNGFHGDSRTIDVHIRWIRLKLESDPRKPKYILTVRGAGYKFRNEGM